MSTNITERTLEREKKTFINFCKAAEAFLIIMMTVSLIGIIMVFTIILFGAFGLTDDTEYSSKEFFFSGIGGAIGLVGVCITLNFAVKIFNRLKDGESPFRYDIADKIKGAGMALVGTGIFGAVLECAGGILIGAGVLVENDMTSSLGLSDFMIWGALILAVSYVFNYGCKLQQESDETL